MIFLNLRKILQGSHNFRKIDKNAPNAKTLMKSNEILMKFGSFSYFSHFPHFFPNSAPFAHFHQILHISSFFTFSPNSAPFIDFRTFWLQCATCEICFVFPMKLEPFLVISAPLGGNH